MSDAHLGHQFRAGKLDRDKVRPMPTSGIRLRTQHAGRGPPKVDTFVGCVRWSLADSGETGVIHSTASKAISEGGLSTLLSSDEDEEDWSEEDSCSGSDCPSSSVLSLAKGSVKPYCTTSGRALSCFKSLKALAKINALSPVDAHLKRGSSEAAILHAMFLTAFRIDVFASISKEILTSWLV